jgi:murein DD-endopeptidase MepM/ murein hydrolase activator NlpD
VRQPVETTPVTSAEAQPATTDGVNHVVERGQTLWRIARTYGVDVDELARVNGISDSARLEVGQVLFIPNAKEALDVPPYPAPLDSGATVPTAPDDPVGGGWIWPVQNGEILSYYGAPRRTHRHQGIDIRGRSGQPVRAARSGRVTYSGSGMRGYGKTVIIDHGNGLSTLYAHNSNLLVRKGERVERGETIARVGRTGNASTDHCHFEIRKRDRPVDPLTYLAPAREARR